MRIKICDVCDEKYGDDDPMIEMVIPAYFINEAEIGLTVDVCSWECVQRIAMNINPEEHEDEPEASAPAKKVAVRKEQPTDVTFPELSEQQLAEYTEQVTGVKRRY